MSTDHKEIAEGILIEIFFRQTQSMFYSSVAREKK